MTTTTILRLPHLLPFECLAPGRSFLGCFVFVLWCEGPGKFRKALKFVGNFFDSFGAVLQPKPRNVIILIMITIFGNQKQGGIQFVAVNMVAICEMLTVGTEVRITKLIPLNNV